MATDIRVPTLGESVTEATIGQWFKKVGDTVAADEPVVELETDKVTIEVPAPAGGVLESIAANPGDTVNVGALIGAIGAAGSVVAAAKPVEAKADVLAANAAGPEPIKRNPPPSRPRLPTAMASRCRRRRARPSSPPRTTSTRPSSMARASVAGAEGRRAGGDRQARDRRCRSGRAGGGSRGQARSGSGCSGTGPAAAQRLPLRGGPRPGECRRRSARRAGEDDPPAPDHRAPAEGRAELGRHADHLQRGGHEAGDGPAQFLQGPVREKSTA